MTKEIAIAPLHKIRIDGGTQSRVNINDSLIAEYAESVRSSHDMPPVVVFFDGVDFWLADGFHRYFAHKSASATEISVEIHEGTNRDAILYSCGANAVHGQRRTNEDKRKAVMTMLDDKEWSKLSDREIAKQCGVGHPFVGAIRNPEAANRQHENRIKSASNMAQVESDSTLLNKKNSISNKVESDSTQKSEFQQEQEVSQDFCESDAEPSETDDIRKIAQDALADNEMMGKIFDADDRLKAALEECKRYKAISESAESRYNAQQGKVVALAKQVTFWKNKFEKLEKSLKVAA